MTKAALCITCADIVSPYRDDGGLIVGGGLDGWRFCQCQEMGVRWRDGKRGLIEVTALHGPEAVRVIGLNNMFLGLACQPTGDGVTPRTAEQWRNLHALCCEKVEPHYLFHADNRACWALVVRVGESGDVFFIPRDAVGVQPEGN
jgi:hypothetical protein